MSKKKQVSRRIPKKTKGTTSRSPSSKGTIDPPEPPRAPISPKFNAREVPIVAVGASAGGLEALREFISQLLPNNMSYILMQHLAESRESPLPRLLQKSSKLPIEEGKDGTAIAPNKIYVLPSNGRFGILRRKLVYVPNEDRPGMPIDALFESLAEDIGNKAIGVVLSGTGSDGTLGLIAIKTAGGITFAQDESAKFDGMPKSAIASGNADMVLAPGAIAQELNKLGENPVLHAELWSAKPFIKNEKALARIFYMLRHTSGLDFSNYKSSTVRRRILRRMLLAGIPKVEQYVTELSNDPKKLQELYNDLLINVTSFFRDEAAFDTLKAVVFPEIVRNRDLKDPVRIWVPGCSTGEEVYSVAIALLEYLGEGANQIPIQMFGTDVSEPAIDKARKGIYPAAGVQQLSSDRQRKYFKRVDDSFQISKRVRDLCIFARQNVLKDPPFSRLDFICCRNLLIYLNASIQKQLVGTFYHALVPGGYLLLGTSETTGFNSELFQLMDRKNKIYQKKESAVKQSEEPEPFHVAAGLPHFKLPRPDQEEHKQSLDIQKEAERIILTDFAPPGVIIDEKMDILHFRGQTSRYLQPAQGAASLNLLRMAAEPLRLKIRMAVMRAKRMGKPVTNEGLTLEIDGRPVEVTVKIIPFRGAPQRQQYFVVLFEEKSTLEAEPAKGKSKKGAKTSERRIKILEQELAEAKDYLQRTIEEHDAYTEELKSANEEIQSSNEELQSTNQELETAKEEMQSVNEELTTLNDELQVRNTELSQVNNDLSNLLANVTLTVVMVGMDLRIRRFNPKAALTLNLIPTDVGRPIGDIKPNVHIENIEGKIRYVIDSIRVHEEQVKDKSNHWYSLSIRPYKTAENKIDGAILLLVDSEQLRPVVSEAEQK